MMTCPDRRSASTSVPYSKTTRTISAVFDDSAFDPTDDVVRNVKRQQEDREQRRDNQDCVLLRSILHGLVSSRVAVHRSVVPRRLRTASMRHQGDRKGPTLDFRPPPQDRRPPSLRVSLEALVYGIAPAVRALRVDPAVTLRQESLTTSTPAR
jgi:hypothetical protein